ncbi:MAG: hypothetical protein ACE5JL_15645, partial [Dehalococcoidia bacterium]
LDLDKRDMTDYHGYEQGSSFDKLLDPSSFPLGRIRTGPAPTFSEGFLSWIVIGVREEDVSGRYVA